MPARTWKCRKCGQRNARIKQKCCHCGNKRPAARRVAHKEIMEVPYPVWEAAFGNRCNVCGVSARPGRNLDRDHDHKTGEARGLLCHRCNRILTVWVTIDWLERAAAYLRRPRVKLDA